MLALTNFVRPFSSSKIYSSNIKYLINIYHTPLSLKTKRMTLQSSSNYPAPKPSLKYCHASSIRPRFQTRSNSMKMSTLPASLMGRKWDSSALDLGRTTKSWRLWLGSTTRARSTFIHIFKRKNRKLGILMDRQFGWATYKAPHFSQLISLIIGRRSYLRGWMKRNLCSLSMDYGR